MARVGVVFSPPVMICMALICTLASLLVLLFGSCGLCCCSVFHYREAIACVDLSKDATAAFPVGVSQFFHKREPSCSPLIHFLCVLVPHQFFFFLSFLVEFDAQVYWCFSLRDWLIVDSEAELLFDVGEGEAGLGS